MRIRLRWADKNLAPHTTKIFRSDTQPTGSPTGTPLVTLTNGETTWDDTTVVRGNVYWYTFEVSNATNKVASVPVQVTALPRTGPGVQEPVWGDQDWGFYGVLDEASFLSSSRLFSQFAPGGIVNPTANTWHKWVRNGKTLFVPRRAVSYSVVWNTLYSKGLVFGVSGPGPQKAANPEKDQLTTFQLGSDEFIVRLPTGFADADNPTRLIPAGATTSAAGPYRKDSEVADLFWAPISLFPTERNKAMNGTDLWIVPSQTGMYYSLSGCRPICQELTTALNTIHAPNPYTSDTDLTNPYASTAYGVGATDTALGWWPILELIETLEVVI